VEAGFDAGKVRVIPNSVPALPVSGTLASAAFASGAFVGYVGRLSEEKGWDLLVEVAERNPSIRFEVAGEGTLRSLPDNIRFRGFLEGEDLAAFYCEARFIVIPSRCYEGLPVVALEAMSAGKAVIAPDHGGFTELIGRGPEAAGCLFAPGEVAGAEAAIRTLWADEEQVRAMGLRAKEKVRTCYSAEQVSLQWEELFDEITTV
jgi:glycosyltransferase involved in cell wall biosynthesis